MIRKITWGLWFFASFGCAQSQPVPDLSAQPPLLPDSNSQLNPHAVKSLWQSQAGGKITDVSLSENGKRILVAIAPDSEIRGNQQKLLLALYRSDGHVLWRNKLKATVKELDLSSDGTFAVVANYENQVQGYDGTTGKVLWTYPIACKPIILSSLKKVICYHDDDPGPGVAFEILDWNGKREKVFPSKDDILTLNVSKDDKSFAIGLTQGKVVFFQDSFDPRWEKKVVGEIVDLSLSTGPSPKIAALSITSNGNRRITVFDNKGQEIGAQTLLFPCSQIEMDRQGNQVFLYGNSSKGQYLGAYPLPELIEKWKFESPLAADFTSSISVSKKWTILGFENHTALTRQNHLLGFNFKGQLVWSLPVLGEHEGIYLYTQEFAEGNSFLVVGTDDGRLSGFRIERESAP